MDVAKFLRSVEIFASLGAAAADRLAREAVEHRFPRGETILRRGEPGDSMFLLVDGSVHVPIFDPDGNQQFVAQLGAGKVFGEMALLTGEARVADVIAVDDCHCLMFRREAVEELLAEQPDVAQFLTTILGERLMKSGVIRQIGKYRLAGELGRGGMSIVYEGIHPELERPVAIKMLAHQLVYRPRFRERFRNEARIIGRLRHPHIVEVYDTEDAYATFFIVMERLQGLALDAVLRQQGRLLPERVRSIVRQVASALQLAHAHGIVHRDIKPSNLMLTTQDTVKLTDFGLAFEARDGDSPSELALGTPAYMAPEQITGGKIDGRTDVYALGVTAYELLVGEPPFQGKIYEIFEHHQTTPMPSPREHLLEVPEDLVELIRRATAKSPTNRFQSCEEVLAFLGEKRLSEVAVRTLTFLYEPSLGREVDELIEDFRRRSRVVPGLEIR